MRKDGREFHSKEVVTSIINVREEGGREFWSAHQLYTTVWWLKNVGGIPISASPGGFSDLKGNLTPAGLVPRCKPPSVPNDVILNVHAACTALWCSQAGLLNDHPCACACRHVCVMYCLQISFCSEAIRDVHSPADIHLRCRRPAWVGSSPGRLQLIANDMLMCCEAVCLAFSPNLTHKMAAA